MSAAIADGVAPHRRFMWSVRWGVTLAATVASSLVIDLVATGSGLTIAASGVFADRSRSVVICFLAAAYVVWFAAMRVSIHANWRLLCATGACTNGLSKLGFDIARRRGWSERAERLASAAGYVIREAAMDVSYYVGAFGTALVSDSVDTTDALVFLGGANLGAAGYEYVAAVLSRCYLDRRAGGVAGGDLDGSRSAVSYASFDTDWSAQAYLADYYRLVEPDERLTIAYFVEALRGSDCGEPLLLFGVGPTMHHTFLATGAASEIHLAEYLPANRREIERWLAGAPDAHDWRPFVEYTLTCEGVVRPTPEQVSEREAQVRAKVTALLPADVRRDDPLGGRGDAPYATVISAYCADSATSDAATWERYMQRIAGLVRPGGLFLTAALRRSTGYVVGDKTFPSARVDEHALRRVLEPTFDWNDSNGSIDVFDVPAEGSHGYTSIVLARVRKRMTGPQRTGTRLDFIAAPGRSWDSHYEYCRM